MCGRVIQSSGPLRYAIVDGINVRDSRVHNYPPRWNAAPSQELLVIRRNRLVAPSRRIWQELSRGVTIASAAEKQEISPKKSTSLDQIDRPRATSASTNRRLNHAESNRLARGLSEGAP